MIRNLHPCFLISSRDFFFFRIFFPGKIAVVSGHTSLDPLAIGGKERFPECADRCVMAEPGR